MKEEIFGNVGAAVAGSMLVGPFHTAGSPFPAPKRKLALVGTGSRNGFWEEILLDNMEIWWNLWDCATSIPEELNTPKVHRSQLSNLYQFR